jgi:hypothetical protein
MWLISVKSLLVSITTDVMYGCQSTSVLIRYVITVQRTFKRITITQDRLLMLLLIIFFGSSAATNETPSMYT